MYLSLRRLPTRGVSVAVENLLADLGPCTMQCWQKIERQVLENYRISIF
jgi:hypothetical protein